MKRYMIILLAGSILGSHAAVQAASPPEHINYQGVLRTAAGVPETGPKDMVFRFYDSDGGAPPCPAANGTLLLTDSHLASGTGAISVSGGLFNVRLGEGQVTAGAVNTLGEVFRNHGDVYVEIQVGVETLCPRVRLVSSAYALNASHLAGRPSSEFVDTSASAQSKAGPLSVNATAPGQKAVEGIGNFSGGYFKDSDASGEAWPAIGEQGILARGNFAGGLFVEADGTGEAYLGRDDQGIWATGGLAGGYFNDSNDTGVAYLAFGHRGVEASGNEMGGHFTDADGDGEANVAWDNAGIRAQGSWAGGIFASSDESGRAFLGWGHYGVHGKGNTAGGYFFDTDAGDSGVAYAGYGDIGLQATGTQAGGYFNTVGIGTANPSVALDVIGDAKFSGVIESTSGGVRFPDGSIQTSAVGAAPPDLCYDNIGRFVICGNGTVKDNVTGLYWLEDASCLGVASWADANIAAVQLADGQCGLTDGSAAGDWRLPTQQEWDVILNQGSANGCVCGPLLPDTVGLGCWSEGDPFSGVQTDVWGAYWSSTTEPLLPTHAVFGDLCIGSTNSAIKTTNDFFLVWPVRDGR